MTLTRLRTSARRRAAQLREWSRDEDGLEAVEWVLLLAGGVVPLATIMFKLMNAVVFYYEVTSWGVSLPFP
jgi:Flp pilus assembly pilin Flp